MDSDGGVGAEVVDVPLGVVGVGVIAHFGEEEDGLVVVCAEGLFVHCPLVLYELMFWREWGGEGGGGGKMGYLLASFRKR